MKKEEIGKLIKYERNKKSIDINDLCRGICSAASLRRMESGERLLDFFILERIIERLGKSMNKVEFLYDEHTYNICYLRELIEDYIMNKEYEKAEDAIRYYEGLEEAKEPLHIQYICKMRAVLSEKYGIGNIALIEKAMEQTMSGFVLEEIKKYVLGEEEIILLLMWLRSKGICNEDTLNYSEDILHYIGYTFSDEEAMANIYSKAAWVFIEALRIENKKIDALHLCIRSIDLLTGNGMLLHLPQYLELILKLEKVISDNEYIEWKKQRDALKWVYEEFGHKYDTEEIELWRNYRLNEACLISELIVEERKALKQTQETLAFEMEMDQKTISRIENGRYKPKWGTFMKLKEYMEFDRDICNTHIVVDDFELLELEREVARECSFRRFEKAERLYEKLKSRLSTEFNENIQYLKFMDCYLRKSIYNDISEEKFIQHLTEAFQVTRSNFNIDNLSNVVLTKNEAEIIHKIALAYERLNKRKKGIKLLEMLIAGYENSRVDIKYHYRGLILAYQSLCRMYEEDDQLEKAIDLCAKGVSFELRCYRGSAIAFLLEQRTFTQERLDGDKKTSRYYYLLAYQFMKLMKKEASTKILKKYYKEHYGEELC